MGSSELELPTCSPAWARQPPFGKRGAASGYLLCGGRAGPWSAADAEPRAGRRAGTALVRGQENHTPC